VFFIFFSSCTQREKRILSVSLLSSHAPQVKERKSSEGERERGERERERESRVFKNRLKYDLKSNQIICQKYDLKSQSNRHF
jgi:hypothetical protein